MSRPFRILHVLPDLQMGGGQLVVLRSIKYMDKARFRNQVCYLCEDHGMEADFVEADARPVCLGYRKGRRVRTLWRLIRLIRTERIDLIHTNNTPLDRTYGQLAAILCGVPLVNTLHGMGSELTNEGMAAVPAPRDSTADQPKPWLSRKMRTAWTALVRGQFLAKCREKAGRLFEHWRAKLAIRHMVAVSQAVRLSWTWYWRSLDLPEERVSVVYAGLDNERFDVATDGEAVRRVRHELGLDAAHPLLVYVARLDRGKGHDLLLPVMREVAARWPSARLLIAGDGPERAGLERTIEEDGLSRHVTLLGRRDDVPMLLAAADLFVFPSLAEGFGLAVLEAMAAGRPVVAFRLPALREFVADGVCGRLVPTGDLKALSAAVIDVLERPETARAMGEHGRRIARERFDCRVSVRELEKVYLSVLENASAVR